MCLLWNFCSSWVFSIPYLSIHSAFWSPYDKKKEVLFYVVFWWRKTRLSSFPLVTTSFFSIHDVFSTVTIKLVSLIYLVYLGFYNWLTKILSTIVTIPLTVTQNICEKWSNELAHDAITAATLYQSTEILMSLYETRRRAGASNNLQHMKVWINRAIWKSAALFL